MRAINKALFTSVKFPSFSDAAHVPPIIPIIRVLATSENFEDCSYAYSLHLACNVCASSVAAMLDVESAILFKVWLSCL